MCGVDEIRKTTVVACTVRPIVRACGFCSPSATLVYSLLVACSMYLGRAMLGVCGVLWGVGVHVGVKNAWPCKGSAPAKTEESEDYKPARADDSNKLRLTEYKYLLRQKSLRTINLLWQKAPTGYGLRGIVTC